MGVRDWSKEKVGLLTPLYVCGSKNGAIWMCLCDCGNRVERRAGSLSLSINKGYVNTSCGCMKSNQNSALNKARAEGKERYFTGEPCSKGHIAERRVIGRVCVECARLKDLETRPNRLEYFKEYQRKNPYKAKAACAKHNETHRCKRRAQDAERRSKPEQKKKRAEWQRLRHHAKRAGTKEKISRDLIWDIHKKQQGKCAWCKKILTDYHVDHIEPISAGGLNVIDNLQILCPTCNLKKGSKDPYEWANENGRLL